jgi:hypothetical protein
MSDIAHRNVELAFESAVKCYHRMLEFQRATLVNARRCGAFLIKAKGILKRDKRRWLDNLQKHFKGKSIRSAQNYMLIAENWESIKTILPRYPDLSIDGALHFIKTGNVEPKRKKGFDPYFFGISREWTQMLKETWGNWSQDERDWARREVGLFKEMMQELRCKLIQRNVTPGEWHKYLSKGEIQELFEQRLREPTLREQAFYRGMRRMREPRLTLAELADHI